MNVTQTSTKALRETTALCKEHSKVVKVVNGRMGQQLVSHKRYMTLFDCFVGWKTEISLQKGLRVKTSLHC